MTPTPKHQRCGHLTSGPDGFPCPHPTCWTGGVLQVVTLPNGPEEFWERVLYVPRGAAMFFGWRLVGEVAQAMQGEDVRAAPPAVMLPPELSVMAAEAEKRIRERMAAREATQHVEPVVPVSVPVEPKSKKRGK